MTDVQIHLVFLFCSLDSRWRIVCPVFIKDFIQNSRPPVIVHFFRTMSSLAVVKHRLDKLGSSYVRCSQCEVNMSVFILVVGSKVTP